MVNPNNKIILTMTSDRKLTGIETEDIRVKLNGLSNADYKVMLGAAGIELRFEEPSPAISPTAAALRDVVMSNIEN